MAKKVAILQSNYIPWKGYFDMINMVDEFILYDDMQYTRNDWRNRNKIMTKEGLMWLTIPVNSKGKFTQKIKETTVCDKKWADKHWRSIECNYARAAYFSVYADRFYDLYQKCKEEPYLSNINYLFIKEICTILGIQTKISWSWEYDLAEGKTERLVELVRAAGGGEYLSGPAAKNYIVEDYFQKADIALTWMDYAGYRPYRQLAEKFEHGVSILDLLFNEGENARYYMKSFVS